MRQQLEQAKQEKLAALMRAADMQNSASGGAGSPHGVASPRGRTDSAKSDGSPVKSLSGKQQQPQQSKGVGGWWGSSPVKGAAV